LTIFFSFQADKPFSRGAPFLKDDIELLIDFFLANFRINPHNNDTLKVKYALLNISSHLKICMKMFDTGSVLFLSFFLLRQWFPNFSGARTTKNILVLREAQNIDLY
jgi:hypothetical protein